MPFIFIFSIPCNAGHVITLLFTTGSAVSLLQILLVPTSHYLQQLHPAPEQSQFHPTVPNAFRAVQESWPIICWVPTPWQNAAAQSPGPSCLGAGPGCLSSPVFYQANISCIPLCQNKDLIFMARSISTFNTKRHDSSQAVSKKLFVVSFLLQPGWRDWEQGLQIGATGGPLVPSGTCMQLPSTLVQFTSLRVIELGPRAWCWPCSDSLYTSRQVI